MSSVVSGKAVLKRPSEGPVIVILYTEIVGETDIAYYTMLGESDKYRFLVPPGYYYFFAFSDTNKNMICDHGEPSGWYGKPDFIRISKPENRLDINIVIDEPFVALEGFSSDLTGPGVIGKRFRSGFEVIDIQDELFARENGPLGQWEPATFFEKVGGGLYLLEEYSRRKIPVLFVHGAMATPAEWEFFMTHIDREKYQPWVFYYPTGVKLDRLGDWLNYDIKELHRLHGFKSLYVISHSMGGLITRDFILKNTYEDNHNYVKKFISISAPWKGVKAAEFARYAKTPAPNWIDIAPESEFINNLFEKPLGPKTKYYLFFGYRGISIPKIPCNDGVVTLTSGLCLKAQSEAVKVYGFNENHGGILLNLDVFKKLSEIIDDSYH